MILSNVNIGTGPSSGDGDPIRTAFNIVNENFTKIQANVNSLSNSVTSVAGRTGNVQLTTQDIIGITNYATKEYVATEVVNIAGGNLTSIESNISALQADINTLYGNAGVQSSTLTTLTANAATQANSLSILTANAASQANDLVILLANASSQATQILNIQANLGTYSNTNVASYLPTYTGNIGVNSLLFDDLSVQSTAYTGQQWRTNLTSNLTAKPTWLGYYPDGLKTVLGTNFGFDGSGMFFKGSADNEHAYPIRTSVHFHDTDVLEMTLTTLYDHSSDDPGFAIFLASTTTPIWKFGVDTSRIAFQFSTGIPQLYGRTTSDVGGSPVLSTGNYYTFKMSYDPSGNSFTVTTHLGQNTANAAIDTRTISESLPAGDFVIGFDADQDNASYRTYFTNLIIRTLTNAVFNDLEVVNNLSVLGDSTVGNLLPAANVTYGLGDATHQWKDLWVSNNTIYINSIPLSIDTGGNLLVNGAPVTGGVAGNVTVGNSAINFVANSSGDGYGASTIELIPDTNLNTDQYIIIDPTAPSHIHIRAGGTQDASSAILFLGGEKNHVNVQDGSGVYINNTESVGNTSSFNEGLSFTDATWYVNTGSNYIQFTSTDSSLNSIANLFGNSPLDNIDVSTGVTSYILTPSGYFANQGGGTYVLGVLETPPGGTTANLIAMTFTIYTTLYNEMYLANNDFRVDVTGDVRIVGNNLVRLVNTSTVSPVEIITDDTNNEYTWRFDPTGALFTPSNLAIRNIQAPVLGSEITQANAYLSILTSQSEGATVVGWAQTPYDVGPAASIDFNAFNEGAARINTGNVGVSSYTWTFDADGKLTAPGEVYGQFFTLRGGNGAGAEIGSLGYGGNVVTVFGYEGFNIETGPVESGPQWQFGTDGNLTLPGDILSNSSITIDNRGSGNVADVFVYSADDITLQARDRILGDDIEGGDINIYAGDGSPDDAGAGTGGGGDIQIIGGVGGIANVSNGGGGGFVRLDAGRGGDGSATAAAGVGGDAYLSAGSGGIDNGGGGNNGGDVVITAGDTTAVAQDRGSIILNAGGGGDETTVGGYVRVNIPAVGTNPGGEWNFTGSGRSLEVPQNAEIFGVNAGNLTVGTWGNTIVRTLGAGLTTYDWIFSDTGNLVLPAGGQILDSTGNLYVAGSGYGNVEVAAYLLTNTGNISAGNVLAVSSLRFTSGNVRISNADNNINLIPDTNADALAGVVIGGNGYLLAPNGTRNITLNYGGVNGAVGFAGNVTIGTVASRNLTVDGNISANNLTTSGNITASNFIGNISITGNITGTNPNVTIQAGSYSSVFDNTGNVSLSGNTTVNGFGVIMPTRPAFRVNGSTQGIPQAPGNVNLKGDAITTIFNQGGYFNATTGIFTAPVSGIYSVGLNVRVGTNNSTNQIAVLKNGQNTSGNIVCFWESDITSNTATHFGVTGTVILAVGDYLSANILLGNVSFDQNDNWHVTYLG